jgi:hypothetical protein
MARSSGGRQPDLEDGKPRPWRRRQRDFGYIAWASFLMACAASAVFFAMIDPVVLSGTTTPGWEIGREAGYAIGFFGFWLLTAATAGFVIWLVRTELQGPPAGTRRPRNGQRAGRSRDSATRRPLRPGPGPGHEELQ